MLADRVNDDQKYKYAIDLIDAVKEKTTGIKELTIFAAGYPQKHPEAPSATFDYMHLIRKVGTWFDSLEIY